MNKIVCVYKITNTENGNQYVGSTLNGFDWRKRKHLRELKNGKHHNRHLLNAFNKYGEQCFLFEILEVVEFPNLLVELEQKWINQLNPIYNVMKADIKSHIGVKRSIETRKRISNALTGKIMLDETKQKLRQLNLGKKQSLTTIERKRQKNFKPIIQLDKTGNIIREWNSATEASDVLSIDRTMIYGCLGGRKPSYKGFLWRKKS